MDIKSRIGISLSPQERNALSILAQSEYRDIRQQAAMLIKSELQRRGLLEHEPELDSRGTK